MIRSYTFLIPQSATFSVWQASHLPDMAVDHLPNMANQPSSYYGKSATSLIWQAADGPADIWDDPEEESEDEDGDGEDCHIKLPYTDGI